MRPRRVITVYGDGASRGNPGPAAAGFVARSGGRTWAFGFYLGETTNNVAEYKAVVGALNWLKARALDLKSADEEIRIFLDSELVVSQLNGLYRVKNERLRYLHKLVKEREKRLSASVSYHFVPRDRNREADRLVNDTLDLAENFSH
jgi:ribonuclease HI